MDLPQNIQLRLLNISDFEELQSLIVEHSLDYNISQNTISNYLCYSQYTVIGAFRNNQITGYVIIYGPCFECDIVYLYVKKTCRRLGIASTLINNIKKFNNVKEIFLEVSSKNLAAKKLYHKAGFKTIGIRKKYKDNIDFFVMKKEL